MEKRIYGSLARFGILVPAVNTIMEPEFNELAPEGISVHTARLSLEGDPGRPEAIIRMAEGVESASRQLNPVADVLAYGCTAGSFARGVDWNRDLIKRIQKASNRQATTAATALVKAAQALGAKKLSIATPYTEESNSLMTQFFVDSGFQVLNIKGFNMYKAGEPAGVTKTMLSELVEDVYSSETECLILSCTDMPTIRLIEGLESKWQIPVISSNQAIFWHLLELVELKSSIKCYGKLLDEA